MPSSNETRSFPPDGTPTLPPSVIARLNGPLGRLRGAGQLTNREVVGVQCVDGPGPSGSLSQSEGQM